MTFCTLLQNGTSHVTTLGPHAGEAVGILLGVTQAGDAIPLSASATAVESTLSENAISYLLKSLGEPAGLLLTVTQPGSEWIPLQAAAHAPTAEVTEDQPDVPVVITEEPIIIITSQDIVPVDVKPKKKAKKKKVSGKLPATLPEKDYSAIESHARVLVAHAVTSELTGIDDEPVAVGIPTAHMNKFALSPRSQVQYNWTLEKQMLVASMLEL